MNAAVDNAVFQWEEGDARLRKTRLEAPEQRALNRTVSAIHAELRRRLGGAFTVGELAALYQRDTDWCLAIALELAPRGAPAPDPAAAIDGAFYLYMRGASDFAGGRVLQQD
jgi:hypothetical protein